MGGSLSYLTTEPADVGYVWTSIACDLPQGSVLTLYGSRVELSELSQKSKVRATLPLIGLLQP